MRHIKTLIKRDYGFSPQDGGVFRRSPQNLLYVPSQVLMCQEGTVG